MKNIIHTLIIVAIFMVGGCINDGANDEDINTDNTFAKTSETHAVVIGMENSKFAGSCPGAKLDSDRMYALISKYTKSAILLQDSNATRFNVRSAIENAVARSENGLCIIYYSGHGGSDPFPDTGIEETDGQDEYFCLYDTYLRDNEIWGMISKSKGRVFLIADCCHSRTCFRHPQVSLKQAIPLSQTWTEEGPISLQCWSGCPDDTYSYGSSTGGELTNTLLKYFNVNQTYEDLWTKIEKDSRLKQFEIVQRTIMGKDFRNILVFR